MNRVQLVYLETHFKNRLENIFKLVFENLQNQFKNPGEMDRQFYIIGVFQEALTYKIDVLHYKRVDDTLNLGFVLSLIEYFIKIDRDCK